MSKENKKFLDSAGLSYFAQQLDKYPTNDILGGVINAIDSSKADIDSPAFTGTPTAPAPEVGDSSDRIATTSFVTTAMQQNTNKPSSEQIQEAVNTYLNENGTTSLAPASYTNLAIAEGTAQTYDGENGLIKFSMTGKTKIIINGDNGSYMPYANGYTSYEKIALPHTKGHLVITGSDGNEKERIFISGLQGKNNINDILTNEKHIKYYSDEFFPNAENAIIDSNVVLIEGTSGAIYTLKFPESVFGNKLPKKNLPSELANIISSIMPEVTEDELVATTKYSGWMYGQKMSFAWHEEESAYVMKLIFNKSYNGKAYASLFFTALWYIRYVLAEPEIKYNVPKIYMEKGDTIAFVPDEKQYYANEFTISIPKNEKASIEGILQLTTNINDLNNKIENIDSAGSEGSSGNLSSLPATYSELAITDNVSESYNGENGLVKFTITGKTKVNTNFSNGTYQPYNANEKFQYVPLPHTKGSLSITGSDGIEKIRISVPDLYGKNTIADTLTNEGLTRYYSDEFFPNSSFVINEAMEYIPPNPDTNINTTSEPGGIYTLKFPESAFGDKLPKKNLPSELANFITPIMKEVTEDNLLAVTLYNGSYGGQQMSFAWHEEEKAYVMKVMFRYSTLTVKQNLFSNKWYIRYVLAEPEIKANTPKVYMEKGDIISFVPDEGQYTPTEFTISYPNNEKASIEGISQLATNVNDLNDRVENIEFSEAEIGYPDGSSDSSDILQNLIDNNINTTSDIAGSISIPAGVYKLSKSLHLRNANTHIKGAGGEVILWCEGAFPALIVEARMITIEGLKIYVSMTQPGVTEVNDGQHCGIYVDIYKGIYDLKIKDVDIQGAYRFSTKGKEYSYGIYIPDPDPSKNFGWNYFSFIDNVRCFSLYCGIYIGKSTNSVRGNFYFDSGENIYNLTNFSGVGDLFTSGINKTVTDACGSGYGAIINGSGNMLDFFGQCFGYDTITPTNIVVDDETNPTKIVSCDIQNLTEAAIKVSGNNNFITGFANDAHRADMGMLWFTETARANNYNNIATILHYNYGSVTFNQPNDSLYVEKYNKQIPFPHVPDNGVIYDFGLENIACNKAIHSWERLFGAYRLTTVDSEGNEIKTSFPHIDGIQDNTLAYVDKWGEVSVYRLNSTGEKEYITEFWQGKPSDNITVSDISEVFKPMFDVDGNQNFRDGITFKEVPTNDNPIYIDILFSEDKKLIIDELSKYQIFFNDYICKSFDLCVLKTVSNNFEWRTMTFYRTNNKTECYIADYNWANGGHFGGSARGIRLVLREGYSAGAYNPEGYVGLSLIFAYAGNYGGNAWLPRGGGRIYGNLDMNGNQLRLGITDTLPEASEKLRGSTIVLSTAAGDKIMQCLRNADGSYQWSDTISTLETRIATLEEKLSGITFGVNENGNLTYERGGTQ